MFGWWAFRFGESYYAEEKAYLFGGITFAFVMLIPGIVLLLIRKLIINNKPYGASNPSSPYPDPEDEDQKAE